MSFDINQHSEVTAVTTQQDTNLQLMRWGATNAFPQTMKNLIEQSPLAKNAVRRVVKFYKGEGFEGEDTIVSPQGTTLKKVVAIMAEDYAQFEAFALQCNYNTKGIVTSINPLRITDLRFNEFDELNYSSKIGYHPNFGNNSEVKKVIVNTVTRDKIKWIDKYNPNVAVDQMIYEGEELYRKAGREVPSSEAMVLLKGIGAYQGQVLYHSEAGQSSYPIPPLQAPVNYVLADIENSILMRKEATTGFIDTYIMKSTLAAEDPTLIATQDALEEAQGARGTGKIIALTGLTEEEMKATVLEQIGAGAGASGSVVDSASKSYELCQKAIMGAYLIPPILAGADQKVGFSAPNIRDAYFVFNAQTQNGRDIIESELNRILKNAEFDVKSIKIKKLHLDAEGDQGDFSEEKKKTDNPTETQKKEPVAIRTEAKEEVSNKRLTFMERIRGSRNK